jgi:hypothetical protein
LREAVAIHGALDLPRWMTAIHNVVADHNANVGSPGWALAVVDGFDFAA